MTAFDDLLRLQELDTEMDQLRHRRGTLPQLERRRSLRTELAGARESLEAVATQLRAVRSAQKEAEDHASLLRDKAAEVDRSLYDGTVTAHKELESLQEELASLRARADDLDDRQLELMEEAEPLDAEVAERSGAIASLEDELAAVEAEITVARAEIDAQLEALAPRRDEVAASLPAQLLSAYGPLREGLGVAVARLVAGRCEGCHLEIPSAELEALRRAPDDAVISCPECLRILVR